MTQYTDGPAHEPWEYVTQTGGGVLQRHGRIVRWFASDCSSAEFSVWIASGTLDEGAWLAVRLNRADSLEAALKRLADAVKGEREAHVQYMRTGIGKHTRIMKRQEVIDAEQSAREVLA